jgi:hypothetical protein
MYSMFNLVNTMKHQLLSYWGGDTHLKLTKSVDLKP